MLVIAWLHRSPSAGVAGGSMGLAAVGHYALSLGRLGAGTLLLVLGSGSLVAGAGFEWNRIRPRMPEVPGGPLFVALLACSIVAVAAVSQAGAKLAGGLSAARLQTHAAEDCQPSDRIVVREPDRP